MSSFEERFPFYAFLFSVSSPLEPFIPAPIAECKEHLFIVGPCVASTLDYVEHIIAYHPETCLFWITQGGDFLACKEHEKVFSHPHLYLFTQQDVEAIAYASAQKSRSVSSQSLFFCDKTAAMDSFMQELLEKFVLFHYVRNELYSLPKVIRHVLENGSDPHPWHTLEGAKDAFKDKPLILLGAGSSLDPWLSRLKECQEDITIMAAASSMAVCHDQGISYDMGCMVCPNDDSFERLEGKINPAVMFSAPRCHSQLFLAYQGIKVVLPILAQGSFEELGRYFGPCPILTALPLEASTAVSLCLAIALYLGFNPIILGGVDLAYHTKTYAHNLSSSWDEERFLPEVKAIQDLVLSATAKIYSLAGCYPFKGVIPVDDLSTLLKGSSKVRAKMLQAAFAPKNLPRQEYYKQLQESFYRCRDKWDWDLKEVYLEEELAFKEFLKHASTLELYEELFASCPAWL